MRIFVYLYIALCLIACKNTTTNNIGDLFVLNTVNKETIKLNGKVNENGSFDLEQLIDTLFLVSLSNEVLIANVEKLLVLENRIVIHDSQIDRILIFDFKGQLISKIEAKGKGPMEYVKIADFLLHEQNGGIIQILDHFNRKILFYSLEGDFISYKPFPTHAYVFGYLGRNKYAIFNDFNPRWNDVNYNVFVTDEEGTVLKHAMPFTELRSKTNRYKDNYFNYHDSLNVTYVGHYDNHVFRISRDSIYSPYYLDFGENNIPDDVVHAEFGSLLPYVHNISNVHESSNYLTFSYNFNQKLVTRYYNKASKKVIENKFRFPDWTYLGLNFPVKSKYQNFFVNVIDSQYFEKIRKSNYSYGSKRFNYLDEVLFSLTEEDNPVVCFFKLKNLD